jgi:hypothetical protein
MLLLIAFLTLPLAMANANAEDSGWWPSKSPLMIAIVMGFIADFNSPRGGFIQVDLRSMERLQQDLQNGPPEPAKH